MSFFFDPVPDSLAPVPAGGYGPDGINGSLPGQGISQSGEIDLIAIELAGLVDYTASVFGNTLPDPFLLIYDSNLQLITSEDNSFVLGESPFISFKPPTTGIYYFGITDATGGVGDYTLVVTPSGPPISF